MTRRGSRAKPRAPGSRGRPTRPAAAPAPLTEEGRAKLLAGMEGAWKRVWPFPTLSGLEQLSGRFPATLPAALVEAFPLVSSLEWFTLRDALEAEYRPIEAGQNADFEQAVRALAPLDVPREDLIERTDCSLPAYRLARTLSDRVENMRPDVAALTARLRAARHRVQALPYVPPAAYAELDAVLAAMLDYLADIPTKAALKTWRRKIRLNRLDGDPWQLSVWTQVGDALVLYLEQARRAADARRELPPPLKHPAFAYRAAHALLYARYPDVVPDDPMALRRRIERAAS